MTRILASVTVAASFAAALVLLLLHTTSAQQPDSRLTVLDHAGEPVTALVDGNVVRLGIDLAQIARQTITVSFYLSDQSGGAPENAPVSGDLLHLADCVIVMGGRGCVTPAIPTLGWYWEDDAQVRPQRVVLAYDADRPEAPPLASAHVAVTPRPVVLVHGFVATYNTWEEYLGPSGYLAQAGLHGFAVGDGQVTGTLHTGKLLKPFERTNTIAENAAILGEYIGHVKAQTGAEQVDLLAHSMGGLIARYYIDRLMLQPEGARPDIAQLIMLGTPNAGSDCALLVVGIGSYRPASLELRSDYVRHVFNPQITRGHGVPFYLFAGTPIREQSFSACSQTPNDLVVSLESASAIRATVPTELVEVPVLHLHLNELRSLFDDHVAPLLRTPAAEFAARRASQMQPPLAESSGDSADAQFSQVYTGFVTPQEGTGEAGNTHTIHIDANVAVASFGLYDPSRSLTVTVRGASGNVITLDAERNGLTIVEDPDSLLYLGYGFENPRPGPWVVTVRPTRRTPPLGTEYALVAQYVGGAAIQADLSNRLPTPEESVYLTATLALGGEPLLIERAAVTLHHPDGRTQSMPHSGSGFTLTVRLDPQAPGLYGIDIAAAALLPDNTWIERAAYLAFEVAGEIQE